MRMPIEKMLIVLILLSMLAYYVFNNKVTEVKVTYEMPTNTRPNYHALPKPKPIYVPDELDLLYEKFNVPYEYQDYVRQLCEIQNVDPLIFVSLIQIESHWGQAINGVASDYNEEVSYRMYGNKKQYADLGLGQLSTRYFDEFEERYFNPELIHSLGYVRERFDGRDPYVNLQVASAYLGFLYRYFGDYKLAVESYNCGIGTVLRGNTPKITYAYSNAVMNNWKYREKDV